jgi:hypothetical protein
LKKTFPKLRSPKITKKMDKPFQELGTTSFIPDFQKKERFR